MAKSLQEQLLAAGLVKTKQVKEANTAKSKDRRIKRHAKVAAVDPSRLEIEQNKAEKAERDLALNRKRDQERELREIEAQIKQLVDEHQIAEDNEGEAFHFEHRGFVKKVYVSEAIRKQIINGQLAVVVSKKRYRVVPAEIALKIQARDASALVLFHATSASNADREIDPAYAQYQIPDDLIW
ncbi:MAG: DUF2058 domain-containing protein [Methylococcales bacterium]